VKRFKSIPRPFHILVLATVTLVFILSFQNCAQPGVLFLIGIPNITPDKSPKAPVDQPSLEEPLDTPPAATESAKVTCEKTSDNFEDLLKIFPSVSTGTVPAELKNTAFEAEAIEADLANPGIDLGFGVSHQDIRKIYFGDYSSTICVLINSGDLRCKGKVYASELALANDSTLPQLVATNVKDYTGFVGQNGVTCFLLSSNQLRCLDTPNTGQITGRSRPLLIEENVQSIKSFGTNFCFLKANADLYCFGTNMAGQVGNNSTSLVTPQMAHKVLQNVNKFGISNGGACAISNENQLYCWGNLGYLTEANKNAPTILALTPKLVTDSFQNVTSFEGIRGGYDNKTYKDQSGFCYIQNFSLKCFGTSYQYLSGGTFDGASGALSQNVKEFYYHSGGTEFCYISTSEQAFCKSRLLGESAFINILNNVKNVYLRYDIACFQTVDNIIRCAGYSASSGYSFHPYFSGSNALMKVLDKVDQANIGYNVSCAYRSGNEIHCWGQGANILYPLLKIPYVSKVTLKSKIAGIDAVDVQFNPQGTSFCKLSQAGELACVGSLTNPKFPLPGGSNLLACQLDGLGKIKKFAIGLDSLCAVNDKDELRCVSLLSDENSFLKIPGDVGKVKEIKAGYSHHCILNESNDVFCWGDRRSFTNLSGVSSEPVKIVSGSAKKLIVNNDNACVIHQNNDVYCYRGGPQLALPVKVLDYQIVDGEISYLDMSKRLWSRRYVAAEAVGGSYTDFTEENLMGKEVAQIQLLRNSNLCIITTDKELYCSGSNDHGQLGSSLHHNFPMKVQF
jgi:hypothetical protein